MATVRQFLAVLLPSIIASAHAACDTPDCAPPEGWDNFANNFASDIAPLLTLFGEQVTIQYLNESLGWIDSLLFALGPLGIITAMVSAIRVSGTPVLRSLIGRAKESRGTVEADLMSSTSSDVCELWSGEGVVRVLGSPSLLELVFVPSSPDGNTHQIYSFRDAVKKHFYQDKKSRTGDGGVATNQGPTEDMELFSDVENFQARQNPPSLSLNISIKPFPRHILLSFVAVGIVLQASVLVIAAITQYYLHIQNSGRAIPGYAFPIFLVGTLSLAIGMFMCARAIETSTEEAEFEPGPGVGRAIWLQHGGQKVGDQEFKSFARLSQGKPPTIITSRKLENIPGMSAYVTVAVAITFFGFVVQFFGFRAMHPAVTVVQLLVVLIMTTIRSCAHIQREEHNDIKAPDETENYELDWLAKNLMSCDGWDVITGPDEFARGASSLGGPVAPGSQKDAEMAVAVMETRARLAVLSTDWKLKDRSTVEILRNVIQSTMKEAFENMVQDDDSHRTTLFEWKIAVKCTREGQLPSYIPEVTLALTREVEGDSSWKIGKSELEAVLCLWISSLTREDRSRTKAGQKRLKHIRLLGPATESTKINCKLLLQPGKSPQEGALVDKEARYFGCTRSKSRGGRNLKEKFLFVNSVPDIEVFCAQELYALFLSSLVGRMTEVGEFSVRPANNAALATEKDSYWGQYHLENTNITALARIFHECGLGTSEEAYFCIIPAFSNQDQIIYPQEMYSEARFASKRLEKREKWNEATEIDRWLFENSKKFHATLHDAETATGEVGKRLRLMTERLLVGVRDGGKNTELRAMWNISHSRCQMFQEASTDRAISAVNLYKTYKAVGSSDHPVQDVFKLAFDSIQDLDSSAVETAAIIADLFGERRRHIQHNDELQKFFLNPDSLRYATETSISTTESPGPSSSPDHPVPIDLLLIRGYLTPLQMAAGSGQKQLVEDLLCSNPDAVNDEPAEHLGRTCLQAASEAGHIGIVNLLIKAGANVNAAPAPHTGRTALAAAAAAGHRDIVGILLKHGATINAEPAPHRGRTALQAASEAGHLDIVKLLITDLPAPAARDSGRTALQASAAAGHLGIVEFLVASGANVNAEQAFYSGRTALQAAAENGFMEILEFLLRSTAEVNAIPAPHFGRTALQAAAEAGHQDAVNILLERGANVNAESSFYSGRTALQAAAEAGHRDIVKILLERGAKVDAEAAPHSGRTALQAAVAGNHTQIIQLLLDAGADVNRPAATKDGKNALQIVLENDHTETLDMLLASRFDLELATRIASALGHEMVINLLIRKGANLEARDEYGCTALDHAARGGHERALEILIKNGANIAAITHAGNLVLNTAARAGHLKAIEVLLKNGVDVTATNIHQSSALQSAAFRGRTDVLNFLLLRGAKVEAYNALGFTALHSAALGGHEEAVQALIHKGANTMAKTHKEYTALHIAAVGGCERVVEFLLQQEVGSIENQGNGRRRPLHLAVKHRHARVVEVLLKYGADITAPTGIGELPLHRAARFGSVKVAELLLRAGAKVDQGYSSTRISREQTALYSAVVYQHEKVVQLLLENGADINKQQSRNQYTVLHHAAERGLTKVVDVLLSCGARVSAVTTEGMTALHLAAGSGHDEIVKVLVKAGSDIKALSNDGSMPMHTAAMSGRFSVVEKFLGYGVDINVRAVSVGFTALHFACRYGHVKLAELLLKNGSDLDVGDSDKWVALHCAVFGGHRELLELLVRAGANLEAVSKDGETPEQMAVKRGFPELGSILQKAAARPDLEDRKV